MYVTFLLFPHLQFVVSNVVIHHDHNVLIRDTILVENLVGMTYIRLAQWEKETFRSNSDIIDGKITSEYIKGKGAHKAKSQMAGAYPGLISMKHA